MIARDFACDQLGFAYPSIVECLSRSRCRDRQLKICCTPVTAERNSAVHNYGQALLTECDAGAMAKIPPAGGSAVIVVPDINSGWHALARAGVEDKIHI